MNEVQYNSLLATISNRVYKKRNHETYLEFEENWKYYYDEIYKKYYSPKEQLRLIICESGPENLNNYMFSEHLLDQLLTIENDKYLQQIFTGVFPNFSNNNLPTRRNALIELAKKNILILDLLPTHGIKLTSDERRNINKKINVFPINKITSLLFIRGVKLNYVFAVPPTLYTQNLLSNLLDNNFVERGNINIGQGHCPSRNALSSLIKNKLFL
jgi:hypothetical protein